MDNDKSWLLDEKYSGIPCRSYYDDLARLEAGEPLAYVIGHVPFLGCQIWLDSHPLIPRPETEFWVEKAIAAIATTNIAHPTVLDLCAGSGCVGVAVGKAVPGATITFAEIDPAHLPTIEKNCRQNTSMGQNIVESNLFQNITEKFNFILSNPPYIDPSLDRTQASVKNFEPHLALYGGNGGSELIETIIKEATAHLHPHGQLWLEHEPEQTTTIHSLGTRAGFYVSTHPDQYGTERYSILVLQ